MRDKLKSEVSENFHKIIDTTFDNNQHHVFQWWDEISAEQKISLLEQIKDVDFNLMNSLIDQHLKNPKESESKVFEPAPIIQLPKTKEEKEKVEEIKKLGEEEFKKGTVAVFLVAGGQGSRLGFDGPKGAFPVTPIKKKSLFQNFAEKIAALEKKYNTTLPWYIMTSEENNKQTIDFFKKNNFFNLNPDNIFIFKQGMIPAVDKNGKFLLKEKHKIFKNPNGHGGSLLALKDSSAISDMKQRGINYIFYFQVDNVLANIADPVFLGHHIVNNAEMSCKIVEKTVPEEKVGIVGNVNGRIGLIEYTVLPEDKAKERDSSGKLRYRAGNIAMHFFNLDFLERMTGESFSLPYNFQFKKVDHMDSAGNSVKPDSPNAYKFETFIFDALSNANHSVIVESNRKQEFSPVKNASGVDSPETAKQMQTELFADWLEYAGIKVPRDEQGNILGKIEISPLFALDKYELKSRIENIRLEPGFELYLG